MASSRTTTLFRALRTVSLIPPSSPYGTHTHAHAPHAPHALFLLVWAPADVQAEDLPDVLNWCDKDGVNYCTKSLNQHIPQCKIDLSSHSSPRIHRPSLPRLPYHRRISFPCADVLVRRNSQTAAPAGPTAPSPL